MPFDRSPWKTEFTAVGGLPWACPSCGGGRLLIVHDSLRTGQTRESADGQDHLASEPEWIDGRFVCLPGCHHCKGEIALAGKYRVQDDRYFDEVHGESGDYERYYTPLFFSDSPHLIRIPSGAPEDVREELIASFRLYWSDPESAANRIRSALELLLTAQRVNRTTGRIKKNGKREFLSLHNRIQRFAAKRASLAQNLLAVKWLGNAGSHANPITRDDVLDGYEIMEYVLDEVFANRSRKVGALTRAINRRRGPRSPRRHRKK